MAVEDWRKIKGYPLYSVSSYGRIKQNVKGNILKPYPTRTTGYLRVALYNETGRRKVLVHVLVAQAFLKWKGERYISHKDNNRVNNCAKNLLYSDRIIHQDTKKHKGREAAMTVEVYDLAGNLLKILPSMYAVQKEFGVRSEVVGYCCKGMVQSHHGYKFKFAMSIKDNKNPLEFNRDFSL